MSKQRQRQSANALSGTHALPLFRYCVRFNCETISAIIHAIACKWNKWIEIYEQISFSFVITYAQVNERSWIHLSWDRRRTSILPSEANGRKTRTFSRQCQKFYLISFEMRSRRRNNKKKCLELPYSKMTNNEYSFCSFFHGQLNMADQMKCQQVQGKVWFFIMGFVFESMQDLIFHWINSPLQLICHFCWSSSLCATDTWILTSYARSKQQNRQIYLLFYSGYFSLSSFPFSFCSSQNSFSFSHRFFFILQQAWSKSVAQCNIYTGTSKGAFNGGLVQACSCRNSRWTGWIAGSVKQHITSPTTTKSMCRRCCRIARQFRTN